MPTEVGGTEIWRTPEHYARGWVRCVLGFRTVDFLRVHPVNVAIAQTSVPP